ncbi:MAG: NAD(P)H-hydrate dehydratase [Rhodospirillales bacterium]|nr:NAD(P)H-hydrate dehydratase [Rhodospirillales bacterium]
MLNALLTTEQMYKADALTIASGIAGYDLMENAGVAVYRAITERWQPRPCVVLCGPGNNGGDGFVVARVLAAAGWPVRLALLGDLASLSGDAAVAAKAWTGDIEPLSTKLLEAGPLVIDALFGAGLSRPLSGVVSEIISSINQQDLDCVAIDVPSGVDGNSGQLLGSAPRCRLTVSFFRAKPAHYLMPARDYLGALVIADIGIAAAVLDQIGPTTFVNDPVFWAAAFPQPDTAAHKFQRGHLLVAGGEEMTGAARLAARAGRRVGAGLVTIAASPETWPIYAADSPGHMVKETATVEAYEKLLGDERITALVIGPGFGRDQRTRQWVLSALASKKPIVLDADGLSAFAGDPGQLLDRLHGDCVLTPHEGEFARLFDGAGSKLEKARTAAIRTGACILLKGPDTVIAEPSGRAFINRTGTAYLATAGSGDVLAGLIGGLLAQGMAPFEAASAACWMHGIAAERFGPGLIAEDIPEIIPNITKTIIKMSSAKG